MNDKCPPDPEYYDEDQEEFGCLADEEIETCPFGFNPLEFGECCGCVAMRGVETCEFLCPFGKIPLCGEERGRECEKEFFSEKKVMEKDD